MKYAKTITQINLLKSSHLTLPLISKSKSALSTTTKIKFTSTYPIWARVEINFIPQTYLALKEDSTNTYSLFENNYTGTLQLLWGDEQIVNHIS